MRSIYKHILMVVGCFFISTIGNAQATIPTPALNDTIVAINKAVAYFNAKGLSIMRMIIPTIDFLNKRYAAGIDITKNLTEIEATADMTERLFLYTVDSTKYKAPESQVKLMTGIDRISAAATYCKEYDLPADFWTSINDMAYARDYSLTHATLALAMIKEFGCKYDKTKWDAAIAIQRPLLVELIETKTIKKDVAIEALVMLYITNSQAYITKPYIEDLIKNQKADGSWNNNDHSTVLALWALLHIEKPIKASKQ